MNRRIRAVLNREKAQELNVSWGVAAAQARYSDDGHWYALLERFPAALFDANGYIVFVTEADYRASPGLRLGKQISVPRPGISGLLGYVRAMPSGVPTVAERVVITIPDIAEQLNAEASHHAIGQLQELRAQLRSRSRVASRGLFDRRTIHDGYAFHVGGRKELQFNIGVEMRDDRPCIRHGVAFSLEPSRSLPTIEPLRPKIDRFNEYVGLHAEDFPGLSMWHFDHAGRHPDHGIAPIGADLIRPGVFITLGRWVPDGDVDPHAMLLDFDRLLPLYAYVESDGPRRQPQVATVFKPGCPEFVATASAVIPGRVSEIGLRHKVLQRALYECLSIEAGAQNVAIEHELDLGLRVDAAVRDAQGMTFYELKVASSMQACVRLALGQLLEYAYWPSDGRAAELIVVGEPTPDAAARSYLNLLRKRFALPIWYRQISATPPELGPKI